MITRIPLKNQMALLAAIPLLCAVGFGLKLTHERVAQAQGLKSFETAMRLDQ